MKFKNKFPNIPRIPQNKFPTMPQISIPLKMKKTKKNSPLIRKISSSLNKLNLPQK